MDEATSAAPSRGSGVLGRLPWLLALAAAALALTGHLLAASPAGDVPATLVQFAGLPLLGAGLWLALRRRAVGDRDSLLDALVLTVAAALAGWVLLVQPLVVDEDGTYQDAASTLLHLVVPLGWLLVVGVAGWLGLASAGSGDRAAHLLVAASVTGLVSDIAATTADLHVLAVGWLAAAGLTVLSLRTAGRDHEQHHDRLTSIWRFVLMLGSACLAPPVLVLAGPSSVDVARASVVIGGALLLFVLALLRIGLLMARLRQTHHREAVLREGTSQLVRAADRAGVRDAALDVVLRLLHDQDTRAWRIDGDPAGTVAEATGPGEMRTFLDVAELAALPGHGGIATLDEPSTLHDALGIPQQDPLILVSLPTRGHTREAAIVALQRFPNRVLTTALHALGGTMMLAVERLDADEIRVERRSERRLRLMLQYASDVICILDHDLTVVHVTPAVEPVVGVPAPELLGMDWLDVVLDDDRDAARDLVSLAQGGRPARGEVRVQSIDGSVRHLDTVVTEVFDEDLTGFVVTCHDVTERHGLEEALTHQAFHDSLTGLANRALFRDRLGHAMARSRGTGGYAVLFIDLDDFKTVNDSLGHAAGDLLLGEVTSRLRDQLREGDTAARLGGDEFAVLLEDVPDDAHVISVAERLLESLSTGVVIDGTEVATGASVGIAFGHSGAQTPEELMRNADLALYDAKNSGKKRAAVYAPQMHDAALARLGMTSDLRHALDRGEIVVHYQPLFSLQTSTISGLEALVRWHHPTLGLLAPGQFIPLAEETGLIVPIGRHILRTALAATVAWQRRHPDRQHLRIAVNVSARQLQDPSIVEDVRRAIADTGIAAEAVVLEITESILLPGDGTVVERLHELSALGVRLYIDDFGTGYSSLSYLQQLPVHGLKLAQEFVDALPGSGADTGLVRTIRDLATTLGLSTVVAEGIERAEQWETLLALGYSIGQGFHFAVPMPAYKIDDLLARDETFDAPSPRSSAEAERVALGAAVEQVVGADD